MKEKIEPAAAESLKREPIPTEKEKDPISLKELSRLESFDILKRKDDILTQLERTNLTQEDLDDLNEIYEKLEGAQRFMDMDPHATWESRRLKQLREEGSEFAWWSAESERRCSKVTSRRLRHQVAFTFLENGGEKEDEVVVRHLRYIKSFSDEGEYGQAEGQAFFHELVKKNPDIVRKEFTQEEINEYFGTRAHLIMHNMLGPELIKIFFDNLHIVDRKQSEQSEFAGAVYNMIQEQMVRGLIHFISENKDRLEELKEMLRKAPPSDIGKVMMVEIDKLLSK